MNGEWIPVIFMFIATVLLFAAGGVWYHELIVKPKQDTQNRLLRAGAAAASERDVRDTFASALETALSPGSQTLRRWNLYGLYEKLVLESGISIYPQQTLFCICFLGFGSGLFIEWKFANLAATIAAAVLTVLIPIPILIVLRNRRKRALQKQLPDVFELFARALRAGRSLPDAFGLAAELTPSPSNIEFSRCRKQIDLGLSFAVAVQSMTRRIGLFDMDLFLTTLMVHEGAGGNLPEALDRLSALSRDREHFRGHLLAVTAQQRLSIIIVLLLGPLVLGVLTYLSPAYLNTLLTTPLGHKMIGIAAALELFGIFWTVKLLKVQY